MPPRLVQEREKFISLYEIVHILETLAVVISTVISFRSRGKKKKKKKKLASQLMLPLSSCCALHNICIYFSSSFMQMLYNFVENLLLLGE